MDPFTPRMTRAAVWRGSATELVDVPVQAPAPGELLVKVDLATVCGSDLHTVNGRRTSPCPSILGHEAVGTVVARGPGTDVSVGERVVWSVTVTCGRCHRCRTGFTAKCIDVRKIGHERFDTDWPLSGGYARHIVLPPGTTVVPVPDAVVDSVAAPAACATATVMAALDQAGALTGRRVLISGAGMLGVSAVAAAAERGAHVMIDDLDEERIAIAYRFGASPDDDAAVDVVFDFTGAAPAVERGYRRLDIGGTLVLAGSVSPSPHLTIDPERMVRGWLGIRGVHNYEPAHLRQAVDFLARTANLPWESLVSAPLPLSDMHDAFVVPPAGILRIAVDPWVEQAHELKPPAVLSLRGGH